MTGGEPALLRGDLGDPLGDREDRLARRPVFVRRLVFPGLVQPENEKPKKRKRKKAQRNPAAHIMAHTAPRTYEAE